jgi:hypothetical protein
LECLQTRLLTISALCVPIINLKIHPANFALTVYSLAQHAMEVQEDAKMQKKVSAHRELATLKPIQGKQFSM